MTANNETLERIKSDAERIYPGKSAIAQSTQQVYQNGAISEHDKAIDEAIETVAKIEFIDRNPANVISDVIKQLATLKSEKK